MHDNTPFLNLLCRFAFFYRLTNEKQADNINNVNKFGHADLLRFFAQQTRGHALEISPPPLHFINV